MKYLFIIKDFLLSRNGLIFAASGTILLSILWVKHSKNSNKASLASPKTKPTSTVWDIDSASPLQDTEQNQSYEPFIPSREQPPEAIQSIPARFSIIDQPSLIVETPKLPIVYEPLIKEERKYTPIGKSSSQEAFPRYPELEQGARIDCQLISSPSNAQENSPILARVVRPLFRDGILLIPIGSSVFGQIENTNRKTLHSHRYWTIRTPSGKQFTISAVTYGKDPEKILKRPGLSGHQEDSLASKSVGKQLFEHFVKGIATLGKDTVRTGIGEYVPSTTRNVAIDSSARIIDAVLVNGETDQKADKPIIYAHAGQEFSLVVSSIQKKATATPQNQNNIDQLLEQMLRKRLQD